MPRVSEKAGLLGRTYAACKNWKTRKCPHYLDVAMAGTYPREGSILAKKPSTAPESVVIEICGCCEKFVAFFT
jgi:hypothetical protein